MPVSKGHRREVPTSCVNDPETANTFEADALPTCSTGPLSRLSWTWHEIMDIIRRR